MGKVYIFYLIRVKSTLCIVPNSRFQYNYSTKVYFKSLFLLKNRRICNYLRIKRLFGLLENWVTRQQPFLFQSSLLFCISTNDELKNIAQVEHSRHRCFDNFIVNLLGAIAAYCCFPKKPCINVERTLNNQLTLF